MKKYEYMIMYLLPNASGSGRVFITRNKEIESHKDIEELDKFLRTDESITGMPKHIKEKVFVSDFKLLRTYFEV